MIGKPASPELLKTIPSTLKPSARVTAADPSERFVFGLELLIDGIRQQLPKAKPRAAVRTAPRAQLDGAHPTLESRVQEGPFVAATRSTGSAAPAVPRSTQIWRRRWRPLRERSGSSLVIHPTRLHVGHFFGTLANRVRLQNLGVEVPGGHRRVSDPDATATPPNINGVVAGRSAGLMAVERHQDYLVPRKRIVFGPAYRRDPAWPRSSSCRDDCRRSAPVESDCHGVAVGR